MGEGGGHSTVFWETLLNLPVPKKAAKTRRLLSRSDPCPPLPALCLILLVPLWPPPYRAHWRPMSQNRPCQKACLRVTIPCSTWSLTWLRPTPLHLRRNSRCVGRLHICPLLMNPAPGSLVCSCKPFFFILHLEFPFSFCT